MELNKKHSLPRVKDDFLLTNKDFLHFCFEAQYWPKYDVDQNKHFSSVEEPHLLLLLRAVD